MGLEELEPIIVEPKPEWSEKSVSGLAPPRRFIMRVYAPDYYHLKFQLTDFHSNTFYTVNSLVQLQHLRDSMGMAGSWSNFVDYLIASVKSDYVKLVLEKNSGPDGAAGAELVAQKSKGMPSIHISLAKLQDTAASDAMSEISFGLFKAFKCMQSFLSQEKEHSSHLTKLVSTGEEKSENIQSQLEKRLKSSYKEDVSACLASNGLQGSPGVNDPKKVDMASCTNQEMCTTVLGAFTNSQIPLYTKTGMENIVPREELAREIADRRQPWTMDEEEKLVNAWLTISNERNAGTSLVAMKFWKRITDHLNAHRRIGPPRKLKSVKKHWFRLLPRVKEFNKVYNNLSEEGCSGWSDYQLFKRARELYFQNHKKHFIHEHVWVKLKDDPKWKANTSLRPSKKTKINETGAYTSSSNAHTSLQFDDNEAEVDHVGQKPPNAEAKRMEQTDKYIQDVKQEGWNDIQELRNEELADIRNMKQPSELYNDHQILTMDTSQMNAKELESHRFICSVIKSQYNVT